MVLNFRANETHSVCKVNANVSYLNRLRIAGLKGWFDAARIILLHWNAFYVNHRNCGIYGIFLLGRILVIRFMKHL
jgi:hypothetical protein